MTLTGPERMCAARCSHGGVCHLLAGHEENLHDTGRCQFTDEERLSDEDGDALFADKAHIPWLKKRWMKGYPSA